MLIIGHESGARKFRTERERSLANKITSRIMMPHFPIQSMFRKINVIVITFYIMNYSDSRLSTFPSNENTNTK